MLRVYVGSFWDEPLMYDDNAALFDMEERDLMNDLRELPRNSAVRKINELVKRCRLAKVCCKRLKLEKNPVQQQSFGLFSVRAGWVRLLRFFSFFFFYVIILCTRSAD